MDIAFYHATRASADEVVPRLVEKALAAGHRVAIRASDRDRLDQLDVALWTYDPNSFLPHARDTHPRAAAQPALLTTSDTAANGADLLLMLDGPVPGRGYARALYVFDDASKVAARAAWRALTGPGVYWKQADKGWTREAERSTHP